MDIKILYERVHYSECSNLAGNAKARIVHVKKQLWLIILK